jgi:hypothetical protein
MRGKANMIGYIISWSSRKSGQGLEVSDTTAGASRDDAVLVRDRSLLRIDSQLGAC